MVTYAADSHIRYGELYWRPAGKWPAGTMITLYDRGTNKPLGQIPQTTETYQVIGFMNEYQVSIGESTFGGRTELQDTTALVDYGSLMFLALQRSKTAREAIKIMAELVEQYGYASTGESFSIGDPNEVWHMELIGKGIDLQTNKKTKIAYNKNKGAVWVALRVPDGYVSAHANAARITTFPLADGKKSITCDETGNIFDPDVEVIYSPDIISFAREKGYFNGPDSDFSFAAAYAPLDFGATRFCDLRVWTMFNEIADGMDKYYEYAKGDITRERIPLFVKPNRKLTPQDLMAFKRNHLEGTELDMSKDAGAGPFGLPYRWRPMTWQSNGDTYFNERATATQQTGFSFVAQMRSKLPNPIGGIFWFSVDDANSTVYVPFYCGINYIPQAYAEGNGDMLKYSDDAAFWVFSRVAHFIYLFYDRVINDMRTAQQELENKFAAYTPAVDAAALQLYNNNPELARQFLTDYSAGMAAQTIARWKELGEFLLVKYLDGNVKQEENGEFLRNPWGYPRSPKFPGYPDSWKENVIKDTGDKLKQK
ncbi:MAG: C69 family dipeptidase [Prolixibacteraceae bacterium]|nr:C69 family dipeptidase [Prolixibacteraceae bacterium]